MLGHSSRSPAITPAVPFCGQQILGILIPLERGGLARLREIRDGTLPAGSPHKCLPQGRHGEGAAGKLPPVVVDDRSVGAVAEVPVVPDGHKAVVRIPAGAAGITPFIPVGQGDGITAVEADGKPPLAEHFQPETTPMPE